MSSPLPTVAKHAAKDPEYVVMHVVVQETAKPLVGPQVLDNMQSQVTTPGLSRPTRAIVVLLEPLRSLFSQDVRKSLQSLRARAPDVKVSVLPYVSRLRVARNASFLAPYVKRQTRGLPVVFHCRNERAVEWANALSGHLGRTAIVADIRGAWPEELLFAKGRSDSLPAQSSTTSEYEDATRNLITALGASHRATTVSDGMSEWLARLGVARAKMSYVPCCVRKVTYDERTREDMRAQLGLSANLVLVYAGVVNRFQYLTDGLGDFVARALRLNATVHFMAITPDRSNMLDLLARAGVDDARTSIIQLPQEQVSRYLMAADAGLILGRPSVLKTVAQPVKFGEYVAAGLPIVASRGSLGVDSLVTKYQAGILLNYAEGTWSEDEIRRALDTLVAGRGTLRTGALMLCREHLLWDAYVSALREAYIDALAMAKVGRTCLPALPRLSSSRIYRWPPQSHEN